MANVSGVGGNPLGFNSDQVISQLVNSQFVPRIDRLNSRVDQAESTQSAYRDLNSAVENLQSSIGDLTNPSTFQAKSASSSDTDVLETSVVDADQATTGTDNIDVNQLASAARVKSGQFINNQKLADSSITGSDGLAATSISDFEVVSGGETLDTSEDYLGALSNDVQRSEGTGKGDADEFTNTVDPGGGNTNTHEAGVDLDDYSTFDEMMNDVNSQLANDDEGQRLKMSYDQSRNIFKFTPTNDPDVTFQLEDNEGNIDDASKGFLQQVGIAENENVHEFTDRQSDIGRNLVSVDSGTVLNNVEFAPTNLTDTASGSIRVINTEISYDTSSDSINDIVNRIDSDGDNVNASYDNATDKITLESETTGKGDIIVEDVSGNLAEALNLRADGTDGDGGNGTAEETTGQDAELNYNGTTLYESSNTFTRNGIEYQLKDKGSADVSVEQDAGSVADTVSSSVDSYNSVIETINSNSNVDTPDSPNGEENDSGALVGSSTAQTVKRQLNSIVSKAFGDATGDNAITNSSNVGIELTDPLSGSQSERGKIQFDKGKFTEALENDSEAVTDLFTAREDDPDQGGNQDGMAVQLNSFAESTTGLDGFISSRIDGFDRRIEDLNDRLERQRERAQGRQEQLQQRFLRLEQQMVQLQQQSRLGRF